MSRLSNNTQNSPCRIRRKKRHFIFAQGGNGALLPVSLSSGMENRGNLIPDFGEAEEEMALPTAEGQHFGGA